MSRTLRRRDRSGSIVVLALFLMVIMLSIVALAVDIGYLQVASSELHARPTRLRSPPRGSFSTLRGPRPA